MSSRKRMTSILDDIEAIDGYRTACAACPANAAARRGHSYTLFSLSDAEEDAIRSAANQIEMMKDVMIVPLAPSADNGYPHTRPLDCVCIQPQILKKNLLHTLIHESIHIHQRRQPDMWESICRHEGWTPYTNTIPEKWKSRCRINPDTMSSPFWAWEGIHLPLPLFRSSEPQNLGDVDIQWWDLRMGSLFHEPPRSFQARYGKPSQPEHPFELLAVEASNEGILAENDLVSFLRTV